MAKEKRKSFIQIIVQEKGTDHWNAFCLCRDEEGQRWELKRSDITPTQAVAKVYEAYIMPTRMWCNYGYVVKDGQSTFDPE